MARPSKPWFRTERGKWYVTFKGVVHDLGSNEKEAHEEFHRLLAEGSPKEKLIFADLVKDYLLDLKLRVSPNTHQTSGYYLNSILVSLGSLCPAQITTARIREAVLRKATWGSSTQWLVLGQLSSVFKWGIENYPDKVPLNPVSKIKKPVLKSRSVSSIPTPEEFEELLADVSPSLANILIALHDTGARPSEVLKITSKDFDSYNATWTFVTFKSAKSGKPPRVIHLTPRVVLTCMYLAKQYISGPLYRTSRGQPFGSTKSLASSIRAARRRLNLSDSIVPYGLRHGFVTDALIAGVPETVVAGLVGHSSTHVIHLNYSHVGENARAMKDALKEFRESKLGPRSVPEDQDI